MCFEEYNGEKFFVTENNHTSLGIAEALGVPVEKLLEVNQGTFPGLKAKSKFKARTLVHVPPGCKEALAAGSKTATPLSHKEERGARAGEKRGRDGAGGVERSAPQKGSASTSKFLKRAKPEARESGTPNATSKRSSHTIDSFTSTPALPCQPPCSIWSRSGSPTIHKFTSRVLSTSPSLLQRNRAPGSPNW
jgi:hypothetical protein